MFYFQEENLTVILPGYLLCVPSYGTCPEGLRFRGDVVYPALVLFTRNYPAFFKKLFGPGILAIEFRLTSFDESEPSFFYPGDTSYLYNIVHLENQVIPWI